MNPAGPVSNWRRRGTRPVAAGAARLPGPAFLACLAPLASLALLAACGGGGSGTASSPVAAPEAGTVTTLSCVAEASATTALGRLHNNNYQDAQGGEVYAIEFTVEDIDYLDSRAESEARRNRHTHNSEARQPATA